MKFYILIGLVIALLFVESCKPDETVDRNCFIPSVGVNLTINMDLPDYFLLQNLGEYKEFGVGSRGIYVIHNYDDIFYAIERTCTYNSDNECAQVYLDNDVLQLKCGQQVDTGFVQCCASTFSFNSARLTGPAVCNLRTYRIQRSGNTLYVSN